MQREHKKIWVVFHFDNKLYKDIKGQLKAKGYNNIRVYIPMLSILKKRMKGKDVYEDVPMLFSYGFMKIPTELALSRPFLNKLKKDIPGIHSWVKSTETMFKKKLRRRIDNAEDWDDFSIVAIVSREEIKRFKGLEASNKVYTDRDIIKVNRGDLITLKGYPFDNVEALVVDMSLATKTIKVEIITDKQSDHPLQISLPFDNVIYTIYRDYEPDTSRDHVEDNINNFNRHSTENE